MHNRYDLGGYSDSGQLVLIGEVKGVRNATEESAAVFRRNLLSNNLLPRDVYFLLAYGTSIYLWKPRAGESATPDFKAPATPILERFLGEFASGESGPGSESLEFAYKHWLSDAARGLDEGRATAEADRMLRASGLHALLKGGEIRREVNV